VVCAVNRVLSAQQRRSEISDVHIQGTLQF
jgi:hypothetical protein